MGAIIYAFSWQVWVIIIIAIVFLLWLFTGRKHQEYVGLKPFNVGINPDDYIDPGKALPSLKSESSAENSSLSDNLSWLEDTSDQSNCIDYTPKIPFNMKGSYGGYDIDDSSTDDDSFYRSISISTDGVTYNQIVPENVCQIGLNGETNKRRESKGERMCREILEDIYNKPFISIRPDFLKNPETGRNLEIDCYNDELKLGLEFNGVQHYIWPNYTGQTKEEFINQVRRDKYKVDCCDRNGVYLITVPYNVPDYLLRDYITYYLPENVMQRFQNQ